MINDATFPEEEALIAELFRSAGWTDVPEPVIERIEAIEERVLHELVMKETTAFLFTGMTAGLNGIMEGLTGHVRKDGIDYRA